MANALANKMWRINHINVLNYSSPAGWDLHHHSTTVQDTHHPALTLQHNVMESTKIKKQ